MGEVREGGRRRLRSSVAQAAETLVRVLRSVTIGWSPLLQAFACSRREDRPCLSFSKVFAGRRLPGLVQPRTPSLMQLPLAWS